MSLVIPKIEGRVHYGAPLADICWLRIGGEAEVLISPANEGDFARLLAALPENIPVHIIGAGSNLLIRDGGVLGVVIRLGRGFSTIKRKDNELIVGASVLDGVLARFAYEEGLSGLEFYSGIPGTIGGALAMNAGAYGRETADCLIRATALSRKGERVVLEREDFGFHYRKNSLAEPLFFTEAVFSATPAEKSAIKKAMLEIDKKRKATQPIRAKTGGSTFRNPPNHKAWKLIEEAGGRGMREGEAQFSEQHCNFLINHGNASARDIEKLAEKIQKLVYQKKGITLEWEIQRMGEAL